MSRVFARSALLVAALSAALSVSAATALASTPAKVGPPSRITALGDSITRGYNSQGTGCIILQDCPANSWATGTNAGLNGSYFQRVKALNPAAVLSNTVRGNDAVTGARMSGVAGPTGQAATAIGGNPDLVLIEIGANDVCTSSEATMTPIATFRSQFVDAMNRLSTGLPNARIVVNSIPNIFNLWNVLHTNATARLVWGSGICQSMLANSNSLAQADVDRRARVQQRNIDFNTQLQQVCALYIHCHYDGGAAYGLNFLASDVGTIDFFHPNTSGQKKAAEGIFNAGPSYLDTTAPTTTISRDRPADGTSDWYRNNVTVTLTAAGGDVNGTEYFYKLVGAQDLPWTKYTGPITVTDEGSTEIDARSVDVNGNIEASKSDVIKIDKHAPTFTLSCPTGPYTLGSSQSATISGSADDRSGFDASPDGTFPIDTTVPGNNQPNDVEIADRAGNTTQHSCSYDVHYPDPGAPSLTSGSNPNASGMFTLTWNGSDPANYGIRYQLQHKDADDAVFSDVTTGLSALSYALTNEAEGTWRYRVKGSDASDAGLDTAFSPESAQIKVDKSPPAAPTATPDRAPDYAGGGGWYKDTVTVNFTDNGDPALQDGSAGSGVDASTLAASITSASSGSHTPSGTVKDNVGNESPAGSAAVQVDRTPPAVLVTCPAAVLLHSTAFAAITASDLESGLATDPTGSVSISTATPGTKVTNATAVDHVDHAGSGSCSTAVQYVYSGLQQPVNADGSSIFKLGSTVPVKFALADAGGMPVNGVIAFLEVAKVTNAIEGTFVEAASNGAANDGNLFRPNGTGGYIFNLGTKPLSTGTWSLRITLDDGTVYRTLISLK